MELGWESVAPIVASILSITGAVLWAAFRIVRWASRLEKGLEDFAGSTEKAHHTIIGQNTEQFSILRDHEGRISHLEGRHAEGDPGAPSDRPARDRGTG